MPTFREQACCTNQWLLILVGSILITLCVVTEVFYLITSLWRHQYYFMYVYLGVSLLMMGYVAAVVSIVITYIRLNQGRYDWWWPSFLVGFGVGVNLFLVMTQLALLQQTKKTTYVLFMVWSWIVCMLVGLIAGTFSFLGSFFFIKRIFTKAI